MPRSEPDSRAEAELLGEDHDAMVRLYIKTSFMFLLLGLVLGGYRYGEPGRPGGSLVPLCRARACSRFREGLDWLSAAACLPRRPAAYVIPVIFDETLAGPLWYREGRNYETTG